MDSKLIYVLIIKACILVTLTFLLTRTRLFAHLLRSKLPAREQATALSIFLIMAFAEETVAKQLPGTQPLMNARIVAVCAAGLLAGPWVGGIVGLAVTALACYYHPFPPFPIATSMLLAGLAGGFIRASRPRVALRPSTGFVLGAFISLVRYGLSLAYSVLYHTSGSAQSLRTEVSAALVHGLSVALILTIMEQVRNQEDQARAAAMAEVRALQSRMDPHFLFNALQTLAALSLERPNAVPRAADRLARFLRASLDQHERPFVSLREEVEVVGAYLDVEILRFEKLLSVKQDIDPRLLNASVPPFLLQPLVENAVRHGIQPLKDGGLIRMTAHAAEPWLVLSVSDTGAGIPPEERARLFSSDGHHVHALTLLRRRLQGLYGATFKLTVENDQGTGTVVTVHIPLREAGLLPEPAAPSDLGTLPGLKEAEACATLVLH